MNGVEILFIEQVAIDWKYNWDAFWITFAIICVFGLLIGIIESIKSDDWVCLFTSILMGVITGAILALMLGWAVQIPTEYTNQCKVTVLDEVSMNEFTEKYDIISQEGRIYTVREKVQ